MGYFDSFCLPARTGLGDMRALRPRGPIATGSPLRSCPPGASPPPPNTSLRGLPAATGLPALLLVRAESARDDTLARKHTDSQGDGQPGNAGCPRSEVLGGGVRSTPGDMSGEGNRRSPAREVEAPFTTETPVRPKKPDSKPAPAPASRCHRSHPGKTTAGQ